jgi:hypothetical protein
MSPAPALNGEEEMEAEQLARLLVAQFPDYAKWDWLDVAKVVLAARRPATEAEAAVRRVRDIARAYRLGYRDGEADRPYRDEYRAALAPAADGGDPP